MHLTSIHNSQTLFSQARNTIAQSQLFFTTRNPNNKLHSTYYPSKEYSFQILIAQTVHMHYLHTNTSRTLTNDIFSLLSFLLLFSRWDIPTGIQRIIPTDAIDSWIFCGASRKRVGLLVRGETVELIKSLGTVDTQPGF